ADFEYLLQLAFFIFPQGSHIASGGFGSFFHGWHNTSSSSKSSKHVMTVAIYFPLRFGKGCLSIACLLEFCHVSRRARSSLEYGKQWWMFFVCGHCSKCVGLQQQVMANLEYLFGSLHGMMNLGYPYVATVTIWHDSVVACASGSGSSSSGVWILTGSVLLPLFQRLFQWCLNFYDWKYRERFV
ncbi:unnamed protein product, partial [Prunus brigantina]